MKMVAFEVPIYGTSSVVKIKVGTEETNSLKKTVQQPDYSSMHAAIQQVSMPVSFTELKDFYNID